MGSVADVKHVVVLMQENRSFDQYFGMLRGVRGFFDPGALQQGDGTTVFRQKKPGATPAALYPFHVDAQTTSAETMPSNAHGWTQQHACWASGAMTGWRANQPDTAMTYFTRRDIPYHTALAQTFTVCDAYFCSVLGPTSPNRLYLMSGTIDPGGTRGGPATSNPPRDHAPLYHWKSYPKALSDAGVSWAVYDEQDGHPSQPPFDLNVAAYFADWAPTASTHRTGDHRFEQDLAGGTLPAVSWIVPPYGYTEHPRFSPTNGAHWIAQKIQALIASPYWSSTVLVVTYDENDGSFDHVPPPTAPAGTADEWVNGLPIGPGFRVPCIVVSPWTVGGRVSTARYDHTSVLRLMETVTGVAAQNISAYRRGALHNLGDALDFSSLVAAGDVPPLPAAPAFVAASLPAPVVPTSQTWPPSRARRAAIGWLGGHAYFFRGERYLRYVTGTTGVAQHPEAGYPRPVAGNWPEVSFVDAGCAMPNGKAYVFSGDRYVRYSAPAGNPDAVAGDYTPDPGYPNPIWPAWGGFWAADLDAVVAWPDGFTYFFQGTEYLRCPTNTHVADHAPRPIAQAFPGVIDAFPRGIDAAVVWSPTKAYFFRAEHYVRFTIGSGVDAGYPKAISAFSPELAAL